MENHHFFSIGNTSSNGWNFPLSCYWFRGDRCTPWKFLEEFLGGFWEFSAAVFLHVQVRETCSPRISSPENSRFSPENWWLEDDVSFWNGPFLWDIRDFFLGGVVSKTCNLCKLSPPGHLQHPTVDLNMAQWKSNVGWRWHPNHVPVGKNRWEITISMRRLSGSRCKWVQKIVVLSRFPWEKVGSEITKLPFVWKNASLKGYCSTLFIHPQHFLSPW